MWPASLPCLSPAWPAPSKSPALIRFSRLDFLFITIKKVNMSKRLIIAALAATASLAAVAQDTVTLYGIAYAGVAVENVGTGRAVKLVSGTQSGSRLGFKGSEDLGGGLKALFNLEAGFSIDTGTMSANSQLFNRRAVVGVDGSFGSVTMGREYTPIALIAANNDPLEHGFYGTDLNAFDDKGNTRIVRRASNTVNYETPSFSGVKARAAYGFGEKTVAPAQPLGNWYSLSVDYTNQALYLGAAYQQIERLASGDDKAYILGAAYKFDAFQLRANYLSADPEGANNKFEQVNVGVSMVLGNGRIYTSVQQDRDGAGGKATGYAATYSQNLSKRTNVFASYGTLNNNSTGQFSLYSAGSKLDPAAAGADPSGFAIGMRHKF